MSRHRPTLLLLALFACGQTWAVSLPDITAAQSEQHDWVDRNGGNSEQQLDLETQLAYVSGNINFTLVQQIEGVGNRAEVQQAGVGNLLATLQGYGDGNLANVEQIGNNNYAVLSQGGNNNLVSQLSQVGDNNRATLSQQGDNNTASISHVGNNNSLELRQIDSYNTANIEQYGDTDILITQTNPGGSAAAINSLDFKAYTEPGYGLLAHSVQLDGPGNTPIALCNGSPAFCASVLP